MMIKYKLIIRHLYLLVKGSAVWLMWIYDALVCIERECLKCVHKQNGAVEMIVHLISRLPYS